MRCPWRKQHRSSRGVRLACRVSEAPRKKGLLGNSSAHHSHAQGSAERVGCLTHSLRQFPVANPERRSQRAEFIPSFKGFAEAARTSETGAAPIFGL